MTPEEMKTIYPHLRKPVQDPAKECRCCHSTDLHLVIAAECNRCKHVNIVRDYEIPNIPLDKSGKVMVESA